MPQLAIRTHMPPGGGFHLAIATPTACTVFSEEGGKLAEMIGALLADPSISLIGHALAADFGAISRR